MATTYKGLLGTFRITGVASTDHKLSTLWNKTGSAKLVKVKKCVVFIEDTGALLTVAPLLMLSRITAIPTGGTVLTKVAVDSSLTPDTNVEIMGASSADGTASTITCTPGTRAWAAFKPRNATNVGQILYRPIDMLPELCETDPILLTAVQGLCVDMVQASVVTAHYLVNWVWEEYT